MLDKLGSVDELRLWNEVGRKGKGPRSGFEHMKLYRTHLNDNVAIDNKKTEFQVKGFDSRF